MLLKRINKMLNGQLQLRYLLNGQLKYQKHEISTLIIVSWGIYFPLTIPYLWKKIPPRLCSPRTPINKAPVLWFEDFFKKLIYKRHTYTSHISMPLFYKLESRKRQMKWKLTFYVTKENLLSQVICILALYVSSL